MAVAFHSRLSTAFLVNQRLCFLHRFGMWNSGARIIQSFLHLGTEPSVVGIRVGCQTSGQSAFRRNAREQDAYRIGECQADTGEGVSSLSFELVVYADVEH